jgi:hypothetical protein
VERGVPGEHRIAWGVWTETSSIRRSLPDEIGGDSCPQAEAGMNRGRRFHNLGKWQDGNSVALNKESESRTRWRQLSEQELRFHCHKRREGLDRGPGREGRLRM